MESPIAVRETPRRLETAVGGDPVLVGAGDIASCFSDGDETTAALIDEIPGTVFTVGDNAYQTGSAEEFLNCYGPSWGRHRGRTRPATGEHDYGTPGAASYFAYFDTLAGPSGRGYYSYDLGSWHLIVLDSNIQSGPSSPQSRWLKADLKAHPTACTIAFWHHPLFSSGIHGNNTTMKSIWRALDDAGVDLVVSGHDHTYERFAPQNANGIASSDGLREFVVGTGGESLGSFSVIHRNSEVRYSGSVGVLKLTLHPRSYSWEFVGDPSATFTDTGTAACVQMSTNQPPVASAGGPYLGDEGGTGIVLDGSGSSDPENGLLGYAWDFGDGSTGEGVTPRHAYADNGSYPVTLVVTDPGGLADTAAVTATIANVAPMATFSAPATVPADSGYGLALNDPADVSSTDFLAGFSYAFDCGTGYTEWSAASSTTCPGVAVAGPHTVKGQIRDKDAGVSEYTATIQIEAPAPDTDFTLVQMATANSIDPTPNASYTEAPQPGNLLVAVFGTLHDSVMSVTTPGWTPRVLPVMRDRTLYVYERIADGSGADNGIGFSISSPDGNAIALFEFAASPAIVFDAKAQGATAPTRKTDPIPLTVSTGTANNTIGTFALAVVHRDDQKADISEPIDGWTNGFVEILDFKCCPSVNRSRTAVAVRAVGTGPVETSASWNPPHLTGGSIRVDATAAVVTYASGQ